MTKRVIRSLRKLFGFTKSGSSVVGAHARNISKKHLVRRGLGILLVTLFTSVILVHNFSNIGGQQVLALNVTKPVIDATTKASVQTPINYDVETRDFSLFHSGIDLAAPVGTPVKPIMTGIVRATNYDLLGFGNHVIITHGEGFESIYGHLSKIFVHPGDKVDLATVIGESGSTGFSTGPHLHLEIHQNGQLVNPAEIVPGVN